MKRILLFILLLSALQNSKGQPAQLKFDHFAEKEGLPDPQAQFIQQDNQGYIWIGTVLGLARYDGYQLKVYRLGQSNAVVRMVTDTGGNLWFGVHLAGLFKYNRSTDNFTGYPYPERTDPKDMSSLYLQFADKNGNLWGYGNAVGKFQIIKFNVNNKQFTFFDALQKGAHYLNPAGNIFQSAAAGNPLWIGTNNGLYLYNDKQDAFTPYLAKKGNLAGKIVREIAEAPSQPGVLWLNIGDPIKKQTFIERFDTRTNTAKVFSHFTNPGLTAPNDTINSLYEDSRHRLWFATQNGLLLFNNGTQTFTAFLPADTDKEARKNQIYNIKEAKNGRLWFISGKGLLSFDPETHLFRRFTKNPNQADGLSWNDINKLFFDKAGILWAGNLQTGIDKLNMLTSAFHNYPYLVRDGSADHYGITNNLTVDTAGYCWFSNNAGIYKWKPGMGDPVKIYNKRSADNGLDAIMIARDGQIYFNNRNGMQVYNPASRQLQSYASVENDTTTISGNKINYLFQDHAGIVWIGTETGGLCSFNPATRKFRRYPYYHGTAGTSDYKLDSWNVCTIYEDKQNTIWVGGTGGGLNRFDRKTGHFKSYNFDGRIHVGSISHVFEDSKGRLWVGTYPAGLFEFDRKSGHYTRHLNEDNGLLFNTVTSINEDKKGFLWVNSVRGLTRVNPNDLSVKTYPVKAIVPGKSILDDYNLVQINETMVMALTDGITVVNLDDLDGNPYPPVVHIEKLAHSNQASAAETITTSITYGLKQIELPWNQNKVTFSYVALHYANPAQNRYAYRLDGYDTKWIPAGTQRSATYTNLSPGTYTFRVKACNSDGVWDNNGDSFMVIIRSPWWERWWAWAIYVVLFAAGIYSVIAWRSYRLIRQNQLLEDKIDLRTKQLSLANKELSEHEQEILAQRDQLAETITDLKTTQNQLIQSEKMASLGELTSGIAHEIQNPLNFVNNFSEVNLELIDEMKEELQSGHIDDALAIADDIKGNQQKITMHGKRADNIVKGMLQHSKTGSGTRELTNINNMADELIRRAYSGFRAKDKLFCAGIVTHFDEKLPLINVIPQDLSRVLLNLFNNALYAVGQKTKTAGPDYKPEVSVETFFLPLQGAGGFRVRDNGTGIPDAIKDKIMQPFFTTKPTGEGTGLGLSLTYDMVVKGHGGSIKVNSAENEGSEFIITLPIN